MGNSVVAQFVREGVLVLASGAVVGAGLYGGGVPLRFCVAAGVVAAGTQVLKDWVPAGIAVSVARAQAQASVPKA